MADTKKKRKTITLEEKLRILDFLNNGRGASSLGKEFGMSESTVRTIKQNEEAIRLAVSSGADKSRSYISHSGPDGNTQKNKEKATRKTRSPAKEKGAGRKEAGDSSVTVTKRKRVKAKEVDPTDIVCPILLPEIIPLLEPPITGVISAGSRFFTISHTARMYQSEYWDGSHAKFSPVTEDISIRITTFDQITYPTAQGTYATKDAKGQPSGTATGYIVHLWRYDPKSDSLRIRKTFLFPQESVYTEFKEKLMSMM